MLHTPASDGSTDSSENNILGVGRLYPEGPRSTPETPFQPDGTFGPLPENGEGVAQDGSAITQGGTGNPYIDGVLSGNRWTGSLTFSFPQVASQYPSSYAGGEPSTNFAPISVQQQNAVRAILVGATAGNVLTYNSVSDFTNLNVSESHGLGNGTDGTGDLRFGQSTRPSTAYAYYPSNSADGSGGDIWFGTAYAGTSNDYRNPVLGNYAYQTTSGVSMILKDKVLNSFIATGSGGMPASPGTPPVKRSGRSGLRTALLVIVAVFLLVCIGSIVFAVTPYGSDQVERLGTWAAEEQTRQAGE